MLQELEQKSSAQITQQDGISIMNRLKMCVHLLLQKHKGASPLEALLELNHKIISENDSFVTQIPAAQIDYTSHGHGFGGFGPPPSFLRDGFSQGDYDHCISALKQLQKRVTVNLIYDPNKTFKDPNVAPASKEKDKKNPFEHSSFIRTILEQEKRSKDEPKDPKDKSETSKAKDENNAEPDKMSDQENSHMEDLSEVKQSNQSDEQKDKPKEEDNQSKEVPSKEAGPSKGPTGSDSKPKEAESSQVDSAISDPFGDNLALKKHQTQQLPSALKKLAGSPSKQEVIKEIEK